jgi:hypothetical protein
MHDFAEVFHHAAAQAKSEYRASFYPATNRNPMAHRVEVLLNDKRQGQILGGVRTLVQ